MKDIEIFIGDACNLNIDSNSIDLIVTSPPYSGIDPFRYGGNPEKQINSDNKKMLKLLLKSTKEMSRVIKNSGSIFINIGHNNNMPYLYISEI
jgi:DNA modification methylase